MLMQNFVGQVKSVMVFLTVAYLVVLKVADRVFFFLNLFRNNRILILAAKFAFSFLD